MKRRYRQIMMKDQLFRMRRARKRNPIWKLDPNMLDYIEKIGYPVNSHLYRITTQPISDVRNKCGLLKEINYSYVKRHKKYIYKPYLSQKHRRILEMNGIIFEEYNHEILLNKYSGA